MKKLIGTAVLLGMFLVGSVAVPAVLGAQAGGPASGAIQLALRAFLATPHTWTGAQTLGSLTFTNATVLNDTAGLGTIAMVSSAATNGLRIPNGSNLEYGGLVWGSNVFILSNITNGGVSRSMQLASAGAINFAPNGGSNIWQISTGGSILAATDNTNDIGASGATRPRNLFIGTNGTFGGAVTATPFISSGSGMAVANVGANSCGTSAASIAGNNNTWSVVVGATSGSQCRVAFAVAAATRWSCAVTDETTGNLMRWTAVDTTHGDVIGTMVAGDTLTGVCFPR